MEKYEALSYHWRKEVIKCVSLHVMWMKELLYDRPTSIFGLHGRCFVCPKHKPSPALKCSGGNIMLWGCFSSLWLCGDRETGQSWQEDGWHSNLHGIPGGNHWRDCKYLRLGKTFIFQQDQNPKHTELNWNGFDQTPKGFWQLHDKRWKCLRGIKEVTSSYWTTLLSFQCIALCIMCCAMTRAAVW